MSPLLLSGLVSVVFDLEVFEVFAAGALEQNFDFLLGVLERGLAAARELDAFLKFLHGLFEGQVTRLEFIDDLFEISQRLFEVEFLS